MLHLQNPSTLSLQFGELVLTPAVAQRLHELGFTVPELIESVALHKSGLDGEPSVYCGTYGKYNDGSLCGLWIDLSSFSSYSEFEDFCFAIHADEEDPELMFQDYEGFPPELYSECFGEDNYDDIIEYRRMCDMHGEEAIEDYFELHDTLDGFEDAFCGEWDSEEDFARSFVDDCYNIERSMGELARYFDYEAYANDLFMWDYTMGAHGNVFRRL